MIDLCYKCFIEITRERERERERERGRQTDRVSEHKMSLVAPPGPLMDYVETKAGSRVFFKWESPDVSIHVTNYTLIGCKGSAKLKDCSVRYLSRGVLLYK